MVACAQYLGRDAKTCTRGDGCFCQRHEESMKMETCYVCGKQHKSTAAWCPHCERNHIAAAGKKVAA